MTSATAIAQLWHLYALMGTSDIDSVGALRLLESAIAALEQAHTPGAALEAAIQKAGIDGGAATSEVIETLDAHRQASTAANAIIAQQADEMAALQEKADELDELKGHLLDEGPPSTTAFVSTRFLLKEREERGAAVAVKPLRWRDSSPPHGFIYHGRAEDCEVCQIMRDTATAWWLLTFYGRPDYLTFPTLEAAQAAAQLEWDQFVRAALQP